MPPDVAPTVGGTAPDFALPDKDGKVVRLSDFRGRPVVLYFYPADFTFVCTREACNFRDSYEEFRGLDAEIIGISSDPGHVHREFAEDNRLPFPLLTDHGAKARRAYGVTRWMGVLTDRITFVIDAQGKIARRIEGRFRAKKHVREALDALRRPPERERTAAAP